MGVTKNIKIDQERLSNLIIDLGPKIRITYLTLLSLLIGEAHGYEIMKRIRTLTSGSIKAGSGSIYPILRKLEMLGLIEKRIKHRGKISIITYSLSGKGLEFIIDLVEKNLQYIINVFKLHIDILNEVKNRDIDPELNIVAEKHIPHIRSMLNDLKKAIDQIIREL